MTVHQKQPDAQQRQGDDQPVEKQPGIHHLTVDDDLTQLIDQISDPVGQDRVFPDPAPARMRRGPSV